MMQCWHWLRKGLALPGVDLAAVTTQAAPKLGLDNLDVTFKILKRAIVATSLLAKDFTGA